MSYLTHNFNNINLEINKYIQVADAYVEFDSRRTVLPPNDGSAIMTGDGDVSLGYGRRPAETQGGGIIYIVKSPSVGDTQPHECSNVVDLCNDVEDCLNAFVIADEVDGLSEEEIMSLI